MKSPFASASPELLAEIIRQAEARLDAQLTAALGADQRGLTFAGLLLAAVGALLGFAFGVSSSAHFLASLLIVAFGFTISAGFAAASARPVKWEYVGNVPASWIEDIEQSKALHDGMAEMAHYYDEMISSNEDAIARAGRLMNFSMCSALGAVVIGSLSALVLELV